MQKNRGRRFSPSLLHSVMAYGVFLWVMGVLSPLSSWHDATSVEAVPPASRPSTNKLDLKKILEGSGNYAVGKESPFVLHVVESAPPSKVFDIKVSTRSNLSMLAESISPHGNNVFHIKGQTLRKGWGQASLPFLLLGQTRRQAQHWKQQLKQAQKVSRFPKQVERRWMPLHKSPVLGPAQAPLTVVVFSDFECPFCSKMSQVLDKAVKAHPGRVRLIFKHYPLSFHRNAHRAAQASMAAHAQGKFWAYHTLLFQNQRNLKPAHLEKYAKQLGLDLKRFRQALKAKTFKAVVDRDLKVGQSIKVAGTPTVFVNGRILQLGGGKTSDLLREMLEDEWGRVQGWVKKGLTGDRLLKKLVPSPTAKLKSKRVFIPVGDSPTLGPAQAPATLVVFGSPSSGFCAAMSNTLKKLRRSFGSKLRVVYKYVSLSAASKTAVLAAMAAHQQNKFWDYQAKMFANQRRLERDDLLRYARELSLNMKQFQRDWASPHTRALFLSDQKLFQSLRLQGTPSLFLNGLPLESKHFSFLDLQKAINAELVYKGIARKDLPTGYPPEPIPLQGVPMFGSAKAPVTLVVFGDFQCPFTSRALQRLLWFAQSYKGHVRVAFKQFPLSFHKQAHRAAQASLAAHAQGKFWSYQEKLFDNQRNLSHASLERFAKKLGLNMKVFRHAINSGTYRRVVDREIREGNKAGVSGTPTLYVNGVKFRGSIQFDKMKAFIDPLLAKRGVDTSKLPKGIVRTINLQGAPVRGLASAPLQLVVYSDFQCPFCSNMSKRLHKLLSRHPKKVKLYFKHFPLSFHRQAHLAAQAAMAAHEQGKFWEYHDLLFSKRNQLKPSHLEGYAKQLGLSMKAFRAALASGRYKGVVDKNLREGRKDNVRGTPTLFLNGVALKAYQYSALEKAILSAWKKWKQSQ